MDWKVQPWQSFISPRTIAAICFRGTKVFLEADNMEGNVCCIVPLVARMGIFRCCLNRLGGGGGGGEDAEDDEYDERGGGMTVVVLWGGTTTTG